jgi:hypothetical protein
VEKLQSLSQFFRDRIRKEKALEKVKNPNNMTESYNFTFDDLTNIGILNGLQVSGGVLSIQSGLTTGVMTTDTKTINFDANQYEFRIVGEQLLSSEIRVSFDDGFNYTPWKNIMNYQNIILDGVSSGSLVKFEVRLNTDTNNPSPKLNGVVLLFK